MGGYRTWADEETLEAVDLNSYVMAQAVPRFASSAARAAAIGTPETGQLTYVTGDGFEVWDGSVWSPIGLVPAGGSSGQVLAKASGDDFDVEWVTP